MMAIKRGAVIWLMGPTSAGKTTLATAFLKRLRDSGIASIFYDGDEMRMLIGDAHGFSPADRMRTVSGLAHLANKAADAGLNVIVAALTAHPDARKYVRENIEGVLIGEVRCSLDVCAARDPKGLYAQARNGEIETLIGYNEEYIPPQDPAIVLNTERESIENLVDDLQRLLRDTVGL